MPATDFASVRWFECPECGATCREAAVRRHQGWHDEQAKTEPITVIGPDEWPAELSA